MDGSLTETVIAPPSSPVSRGKSANLEHLTPEVVKSLDFDSARRCSVGELGLTPGRSDDFYYLACMRRDGRSVKVVVPEWAVRDIALREKVEVFLEDGSIKLRYHAENGSSDENGFCVVDLGAKDQVYMEVPEKEGTEKNASVDAFGLLTSDVRRLVAWVLKRFRLRRSNGIKC